MGKEVRSGLVSREGELGESATMKKKMVGTIPTNKHRHTPTHPLPFLLFLSLSCQPRSDPHPHGPSLSAGEDPRRHDPPSGGDLALLRRSRSGRPNRDAALSLLPNLLRSGLEKGRKEHGRDTVLSNL